MRKIKEFLNPQSLKYDDIVLLTEDKIILKKDQKIITINGNNLTLLKLLDEEILIQGYIKNIEL